MNKQRPFSLPRIGQRIVKTSIAVLITLLVYYLRGYRGAAMPAEAAITAIICMQPYVHDTREYAVSRFLGTLIGAAWGLGFLLLMLVFPRMGSVLLLVYLRMAIGVMLTLYTCVLVRRPDTAAQAAIVFICVVINFPEIEGPLQQAIDRFDGVLLGTFAAIGVNLFRLPRDKERSLVFFVKLADLLPDRFSQLPAAARFRLNYLYNGGAKICIMSEHAPAFFTLSMSQTKLSVPFIVMDGAAIYDANENSYLQAETLDPAESARLREHLDALGLSYFPIYEQMKRSPYRSYLEGEIYRAEEIVYLKVIDEDDKIAVLEKKLRRDLAGRSLRMVRRGEVTAPGVSSLYFYADTADMPRAEQRLMRILHEKEPALRPREVFLSVPYRTEHDAMHLLHRLSNLYEPLKILRLFPRLRAYLEKNG